MSPLKHEYYMPVKLKNPVFLVPLQITKKHKKL